MYVCIPTPMFFHVTQLQKEYKRTPSYAKKEMTTTKHIIDF